MPHRRCPVAAVGLALIPIAALAWGVRALVVQRLREAADPLRALRAAIAEVEAGHRTAPLVGEFAANGQAPVTFLAKKAGGQVPRVVSDVTGWGETADGGFDFQAGTMRRVEGTDWYSFPAKAVRGARIEYLIAYGQTDYRIDPHNPRRAVVPGGEAKSELVMPGDVPPQEFVDPPVQPAGMTTEVSIESWALHGARRAVIYTPAGYDAGGAYPVVVFHDGWGRSEATVRVLDWLIDRREIEPLVTAFVESTPWGEGGNHAHEGLPVRTFLTREVPAWLAGRYGVTRDARKRAIFAVSYAAKDALDAVVATDGLVGCLGLLIPGRRIGWADLEPVRTRRGQPLRVAMVAGLYDGPNLYTAQAIRQVLADAGHSVNYILVPEGHNQATWRNHLRDVLLSLFGRVGQEGRSTG